ncbi:MAG: hypothetical protein SP1CHLAM54_09970 [Chlamydiia bacterium]|nr:hypothetical protein [Chlamydiia bacterium]MCH9615903.1 hypothetical protein [Chlamydiia bacterium]MCH9628694.1 hypothetical protein [Chlamydiia bacterium]
MADQVGFVNRANAFCQTYVNPLLLPAFCGLVVGEIVFCSEADAGKHAAFIHWTGKTSRDWVILPICSTVSVVTSVALHRLYSFVTGD